jgi:hypothetical protein
LAFVLGGENVATVGRLAAPDAVAVAALAKVVVPAAAASKGVAPESNGVAASSNLGMG